jgi:hypothetical protein
MREATRNGAFADVRRTPNSLGCGNVAMLDYLWSIGRYVIRYTGEFDRTQWIFILVGAVIVGFLCLRGFGSRQNY